MVKGAQREIEDPNSQTQHVQSWTRRALYPIDRPERHGCGLQRHKVRSNAHKAVDMLAGCVRLTLLQASPPLFSLFGSVSGQLQKCFQIKQPPI